MNTKDSFFGKRDDKMRKDVGNIYGMGAGTTSTSSGASGSSATSTSSALSATEASAGGEERKGNKLIVGPDIKLKGEINDCDTIIVEGRVEATTDTRVLQIAESGSFSGTVGMEVAEIRGKFQGEFDGAPKTGDLCHWQRFWQDSLWQDRDRRGRGSLWRCGRFAGRRPVGERQCVQVLRQFLFRVQER